MTTIKTLIQSVLTDQNEIKKLTKDIKNLQSKLKMRDEDFFDKIQDAICYNLANDHEITPKNLYMKIRFLSLNFLKHNNKIRFLNVDELIEKELI